jgi:hypothetical protein
MYSAILLFSGTGVVEVRDCNRQFMAAYHQRVLYNFYTTTTSPEISGIGSDDWKDRDSSIPIESHSNTRIPLPLNLTPSRNKSQAKPISINHQPLSIQPPHSMLFHLSAASVFLVILFCTSSIPQRNDANEPSVGI